MEAIASLLSNTWNFLSSITFPGFSFSFAQLFVGVCFCSIVFKVAQILLGIFGGAAGGAARSSLRTSYRAGGANKAKIDPKRRGDSK